MRVYLGDRPIELLGKRPSLGSPWVGTKAFQPSYNTRSAFPRLEKRKTLVLISTLPNVRSFACAAQVLDLEEEMRRSGIPCEIFHISSDKKDAWQEVQKLHPHLRAKGYTLDKDAKTNVLAFKEYLGIGVKGSHRLAHGIFAFLHGKLIHSLIPKQQYGVPNIKRFVKEIKSLLQNENTTSKT